jgi:transposase
MTVARASPHLRFAMLSRLPNSLGFSSGARRRSQADVREAGQRARCWVVERSHRWMNRFRRILVRWEKKPEHYLPFLHGAYALIAFRAAGLFG